MAYPFCQRIFLGIANIHSVRSDYQKVRALALRTPAPLPKKAPPSRPPPAPSPPLPSEVTDWLSHVSVIFEGVRFICDRLTSGVSVVVHCSDGWDRTPLLTALTQVGRGEEGEEKEKGERD